MARSLRARHGCQAGEKINVAWPTFVAEEFEKKNTKEKEKEQKSKKEDKKKPIQEFECALHEESDFFKSPKKDKSHKANPRMMAGWLLMLCWSVPCCAAFDTNKDLAANHDVNYTGPPWIDCGKCHNSV